MPKVIDTLIINSPYTEPALHWKYIRETQEFELVQTRRTSGYWKATQRQAHNTDDPGEFIAIDLVNAIRPRVQKWRQDGYPNTTGTTKKLLQYWTDTEQREQKFFFCQLEAVETAIWLTEAQDSEKQGLSITSDGSEWLRLCLKLATGTGKTVVMAMIIVWQTLNKIANPRDNRFSKHILVIAPGLTVKDRLQVLLPSSEDNFYQSFNIVDSAMWQELLTAKIAVTNWHTLAPINENAGPKVVKKGPESAEAFCRRVLGDFGNAENILIINDEAHHCHRPTENDDTAEDADSLEEATIWISGIDKIHTARKVLTCYDLSATPFKPTGKNNSGEMLFSWIVSDFGLNDAIESGLVKTPKIAIRDDSAVGSDLKSKLFHIYPEVKDDLNRRAEAHEGLPDLVQNAVKILSGDWLREKEAWQNQNPPRETPPVMIMICNRTETAARLEYSLKNGYFAVSELSDDKKLLRIDQDALDKLEADEAHKLSGSKQDLVQKEREKFNTVGKVGKAGAGIQTVIGVNMLSEGWDARTVTHILGLRAFTSQLLCEQVIGRGLRRISYDVNEQTGLYESEYVTVFGVPFTFLPVEQKDGVPNPELPKTKIAPVPARIDLEIKWPHVLRIEYKLSYILDMDWDKVTPLTISAEDCPTVVEVAPVIEGKPKFDQLKEIDLEQLAGQYRLQQNLLHGSVRLHEHFEQNWTGSPGSHINQAYRILEQFINSEKLDIKLPQFAGSQKLRNILIALNITKIVNHIASAITNTSTETPTILLDSVRPVRSTASAMTWYTTKPTQPVAKSHISHIVTDSGWEKIGFEFERNRIQNLTSWAKNDHLGFEIYYLWQGQTKTYYPDFLLKFQNNRHLILEVKGQTKEQDKAKWTAAQQWVTAVNANGTFGHWDFKVLDNPSELFNVVR